MDDQERRFWAKVAKTDDGCWNWTASKRYKGYGAFCYYRDDGTLVQGRAHRYSWEIHNGDIPDGMFVLHSCDNPACVNPDHLFLGTNQDNVDDMMRKGRHRPKTRNTVCVESGKWKKGTSHWNYRLDDSVIVAIRNDRLCGLSYSILSKKYGVNMSYVFRICTGKARRETVDR